MKYRSNQLTISFCIILIPLLTSYYGCQKPDSPPNIILILADDLGYGDLSCLNSDSKISTPALDQMASEGLLFTDAHSPSAVCTPTRYSILTGEYAWRSELKSSVLWPWDGPLIPKNKTTLPGLLKRQGYHTACIGKWHLGWEWPTTDGRSINDSVPLGKYESPIRNQFSAYVDFSKSIKNGPITRGFDYYFGDDVPNFAPYTMIENDRVVVLPSAVKPDTMFGTPGPMAPGWDLRTVMPAITKRSIEYIESQESPFFLYFSLTAPHTPIAPITQFIGTSNAGLYGDYVQQVDAGVGKIIQAVKNSDLTENTIIIFTSDNGSPARNGKNMNGAVKSVLAYDHNPSYHFRGTKADIWEGGHRVPFIWWESGSVKEGKKINTPICHIDIMATLVELLGGEEKIPTDGYSMLPLVKNEPQKHSRQPIIHHSVRGMFAIRKGDWKYIEGSGSGGWSTETELTAGQLYNVIQDPGEKNNLFESKPEMVAQLQNELEKIRKPN